MSQIPLNLFLKNNSNANNIKIRINICHQLVLFFMKVIMSNQLWYNILNALDDNEIIIDINTLIVYVNTNDKKISNLDYIQLLSKTYEGNLFSLCMLCNNIILYPFNSIDEISLSEMSISEMDEMAISENIIYYGDHSDCQYK